MAENILFILGKYQKGSHPNAICVKSITSLLDKDKFCIDYLSLEDEVIDNPKEQINILLEERKYDRYHELKRQMVKFINMPLGCKKTALRLFVEFEKLHSNRMYSVVVAVVNPAETAETLAMIKDSYPSLKTIIYEIDPTSNRYKYTHNLFQKIWKVMSRRWESRVYEKADYVIHMKSHRKHFSDSYYDKYLEKTIYLDIPSFRISPYFQKEVRPIGSTIRFIYAGAFYSGLREPSYMINVLKRLSQIVNISVDIFTGNSMRTSIVELIGNNKTIHIRNFISEDDLNKEISNCDILLSVGNIESDYLPSKTLSYIGTGKPIIHFYTDDDDVSQIYFSKYLRAISIRDNSSIDSTVHDIEQFIKYISMSQEINVKDIEEILLENTPRFSAAVFEQLFNNRSLV